MQTNAVNETVRRYVLGETTSEGEFKEFEDKLVNFLAGLNRHERRAWYAKLSRKAGKARDKALCAVISNKKLLRRAKKKNAR